MNLCSCGNIAFCRRDDVWYCVRCLKNKAITDSKYDFTKLFGGKL